MKKLSVLWVAVVLGGCGGEATAPDASGVDAQVRVDGGPIATACERNADCDDGEHCNGMETCVDTVCVDGEPPCSETETCDEVDDECVSADCTGGPLMNGDLDGDGHPPTTCGDGDDCDDTDGARFPDNTESCNLDAPEHDEDCDPTTYGFRDIDMDGAADATCFNIRETDGMRFGGTDCNDNNSAISPLAAERCDGTIDEDCDGMVDEDCPCTPEGSVRACGSQVGECAGATEECTALGWSACGPAPGSELCDGSRDEDCDGSVDEGCDCVSGTNRPCGLGACAVAQQTCVAGAWNASACPSGSPETCNGIDDNCNGAIDDVAGLGDACGSSTGLCRPGVRSCVTGSAALVCGGPGYVGPVAEVCDHLNNDCDALTDELVSIGTECTRSFTAFDCSGSSTCVQLSSRSSIDQSPRAAFAQGWSGDFGRANYFRGQFRLSDTLPTDADGPEGIVALVISPSAAVGPESGSCSGLCLSDGLPLVSAGQEAMAVMLVHGRVLYLMRGTSAGWSAATDAAGLPSSCWDVPGTGADYRLELTTLAGSFTATASRDGCGTASITWSSTTAWTSLYGTGPTYPRYRVGLVGDADYQMFIERTGVSVNRRVRSGDRNNCIGC